MKRREFITLLGGAAAWPLAARAQQPERMRRIGVLLNLAADDPESQRRMTAFVHGLQQLGWTDGRNMRIDTRSGAGDADNMRKYAAELVALAPDVILASGTATATPLLQVTRSVPIVFVHSRSGPRGRDTYPGRPPGRPSPWIHPTYCAPTPGMGRSCNNRCPISFIPHVAAYPPGRVHRAVPANQNRTTAFGPPMAARDQA
jgi:ABC transporter substrate binding protein